ncbi:DnaJ-class molecular chaperone [Pullulanibacillus pueri]|uniref:Methionine aminopeptidase n=1 Tax=Pullulanibacillus pueri TaxID=1437324 RepID=A0A8J2ZUC0_9BACL|nr:methionine aminopeptidase [Pullulanibacillus pueri]MBM7681089.1 DnaJ-class molecular chaperone [Pullulanibacillus pueri]GGH77005.1 hypothetical protein GCM10007096_08260 [Pullulanibacillus pueri]
MMGLFNALSNWKAERDEKHRSEMETLGLCPDCNGRGFTPSFGFEYSAPFDCPGCDGTGLYSSWQENTQE